ncbi:uncharacterized protein LOC109830832 [Asparagus officinalis]|uniref:uncharacterized protein LOC109830832 n=1 Tax=Asparagus officinalis TaxID=4686 RepID=UPI00098E63EB|nr:uncharacterized protein LOC109830832 [Asparagus officinalis]
MNDRIVILCSYDGKINYLENNMPVYEGGTTRPLFITKSCTFDDLVNELHKLTLTNSREYHLSVVCNYPVVENRTSGIQISSDYDMGLIHVLHDEKRSVELFIEKHQRDLGKSLNYEGMYSRMLEDPEVDSVGFLSPQQDECWTQSQYMSGPSFVGTSNAFDTNTGIQEDNASVESENDDEEEGLQINSMTLIDRDDGENQHIDGAYVNNEYVGLEDPPPDELQGDEWIDNSAMESVPIGTNSGVDTQAEDFSFIKGDLYESKDKLIHAIRTYSIAKNVKFRPTKNNTTSYNVVCFYRKDDDVEDNSGHHDGNARCPWKLNSRSGSRVGGQFKITAYNGLHTCSNPRLEMNNKNASSSFIYRLILPHLREDLDLRPKDIRLLVHKATNLDVSYHKCWNARRKAMIKIFGDWDKSYEILPHYLEALKRENPGTVYEVSSDHVDGGERRFTGVFWAFGPCIEGFQYCRPLLSIDGTHLYGKYPVEMHVPDRVLRQFTLSQHIPDPVEQINRRRRPTSHRTDWAVVRAAYIDRWVQRWDCIQDTRPTAVDYTTYMRWYWGITRRWITRDPQPLAGHMPRPPTDSYIPSGMNERDYVRVLDSIDADIDAHVTEIQDQVALGLLSRIKKSIAQVFHKTHVDEFAGREDRSRSFGRAYARRRRPRDDDAGTSHADGAGTSHQLCMLGDLQLHGISSPVKLQCQISRDSISGKLWTATSRELNSREAAVTISRDRFSGFVDCNSTVILSKARTWIDT